MQTHLPHPWFSLDRGILKEEDAQVDGLDDAGTLLTVSLSLMPPRNTLTISLSFVRLLRKAKREFAGTHVLIILLSDPVVFLEKGGRFRLILQATHTSSYFHRDCPSLWLFHILGIRCIHKSIHILTRIISRHPWIWAPSRSTKWFPGVGQSAGIER